MDDLSSDTVSTGERTAERFAGELRDLRQAAGEPSFRTLASRSGCISHTTLHEATKGVRFPTWETTEQFVLACGADPADWHQRWLTASQQIESAADATEGRAAAGTKGADTDSAGKGGPDAGPAGKGGPDVGPAGKGDADAGPAGKGDADAGPVPEEGADAATPGTGPRQQERPLLALGAAILAAGVLIGVGVGYLLFGGAAQEATAGSTESAAPGDAVGTINDITLPDKSLVEAGATVEKTWEITNGGDVAWEDRSLVRITPPDAAGATCTTPASVDIPPLGPGEAGQVTIEVTMPPEPSEMCRVEWKMVDADGTTSFPNSRPLYFLLVTHPA